MRRVESLLSLDRVDHHELLQVLAQHFGHAERLSSSAWRFQRNGATEYVDVEQADNGLITKIVVPEVFSEAELSAIQTSIRSRLIEQQTPAAEQEVLFSINARVDGYFQYKDRFILYPVPPTAPRVMHGLVGEHPFIIEYVYNSSPDPMINAHRRRAQVRRLSQYLNLLTKGQISSGKRSVAQGWVIDVDSQPRSSRWSELGYTLPEMPKATLPFTMPDGCRPLTRVNHEVYYADLVGADPYEFTLPSNLEDSLDLIFDLSEPRRQAFDRAVAWCSRAGIISRGSASAGYLALVTAIEALSGNRSARRFREFLTKHVSEIEPCHHKECELLYKLRSRITHGAELLEQDLEPQIFSSPKGDSEMQLSWMLRWIVATAIYNWLRPADQASAPTSL